MDEIAEVITRLERQIADAEQALRVALNERTGWADDIQGRIDGLREQIAQLQPINQPSGSSPATVAGEAPVRARKSGRAGGKK